MRAQLHFYFQIDKLNCAQAIVSSLATACGAVNPLVLSSTHAREAHGTPLQILDRTDERILKSVPTGPPEFVRKCSSNLAQNVSSICMGFAVVLIRIGTNLSSETCQFSTKILPKSDPETGQNVVQELNQNQAQKPLQN